MGSLTQNYLKKHIICYKLFIAIILIEIHCVSNSIQIGSNQDSINFKNSTRNHDYISEVPKIYKREIIHDGKNCKIPLQPPYTNYTVLGTYETTQTPGDFAAQFSTLGISCNKGYSLSPLASKRLLCENGNWSETPQACRITCPSLMSTETTTVKCKYNNQPLENCIHPITGTTVVLSCKPLHEEPNIRRNPVRVCKEGRWDPPVSPCYPTCGVKHPQGVPNIVNGTDATIGDFPWQVGIYNGTTKKFLCGGSIIDQNIILTAAHCITDYNGNLLPVSNYLVAAGKYYRKYDDDRDHFAQYSKILTLHVPGRYTGRINNFALDIGIAIISNPFVISEAVQPVCIELSEESHSIYLSQNDEGIVTGWGYTQEGGELSEVLKELIIPYVPYNKCFNEVPTNFRRYFTEDKICGGYKNNATSVCGGDSGGALVFKNIQSDRYFIQGIVSTSPATTALTCDSNQYSLYTYVYHHKHFVRDIVALNQHRIPLESLRDGYTNDETRQGCPLPNNPAHGSYSKISSLGAEYKPGDIVPLYSTIIMSLDCNSGYAPNPSSEGENLYFCQDSGILTPTPKICTRTRACPSLESTNTTKIQCSLNGVDLKTCRNPAENTIAFISCSPLYEELGLQRNLSRLCKDRTWDYSIPRCTPVCGKKRTRGDSNTVNGTNAIQSEYPWQVAVYDAEKRIICGGSLISENIVLSAAHCFTDYEGKVLPKKNYYIAGGKYYSDYEDERDHNAQYSEINAIHVPIRYKAILNQYESDIAVIILSKPFTLSTNIQPVCIDFENEDDQPNFNNPGIATQWESNNEPSKEGLTDYLVTYISNDKCLEDVPNTFSKFVTYDKICAGSLDNASSICKSGSGGPLIFSKIVRGNEQYYIRGIGSLYAASTESTCDQNVYITFTSVAKHIGFIRELAIFNRYLA